MVSTGIILLNMAYGHVEFDNCTIAHNTMYGIACNYGFVQNPTFSLSMNNTIVVGSANGRDLLPYSKINVTGSHNLIGAIDANNVSLSGTDNLVGTLAAPINPILAPLADNGGPTWTLALLPGSPAINAGAPLPGITTDQRGIARDAMPDIGAFELRPLTANIVVNDGSAQRSLVKQLSVTFSEPATFPNGLAAGFTLTRTGPGEPVGTVPLTLVQSGQTVTATFLDPTFAPFGGSLIDGRYTLRLNATAITATAGQLDGDANGIVGGDAVVNFHRLFGDANGDRTVDAGDFSAFGNAFGTTANSIFDFNGDGTIDAGDFAEFGNRFGTTI